MNRRDFIGGCAAGAVAAFGADILESETKRLAQGQPDVEITMGRGIERSTVWPEAKGDVEYDYFSPLLFNRDVLQ
jgi:hypothetical protein